MHPGLRATVAVGAVLGGVWSAPAQIDPQPRELIQAGYNLPVEGDGPLALYAYYYLNKPSLARHTNLALRLAVAPVYLDSELGVRRGLGPHTDLGLGLAGGGFADTYSEVREGAYRRSESFFGHGGEVSAGVYHRLNPDRRVPLYAVLRGAVHGSVFEEESRTAEDFELPKDQVMFRLRSGLRWGGREPVLMPDLAMELSAWYQGEWRTAPGRYGFDDDRGLHEDGHQVRGRALFIYTLPRWKHTFGVNLTGGTGWNLDRLSAYRLGGYLPLYSEFPLSLPGYYFQELSARSFALLGANYVIPLDARQCFRVGVSAASAWVDFLPGFEQPRRWNTGLGGMVAYVSPSGSWQVAVAYGYGFNARRHDDSGAQSVLFLLQFDLGRTRERFYDPAWNLDTTRGLQSILRNVFR